MVAFVAKSQYPRPSTELKPITSIALGLLFTPVLKILALLSNPITWLYELSTEANAAPASIVPLFGVPTVVHPAAMLFWGGGEIEALENTT